MELLEKQILEKGKVLPGNVLKVGSFLNQQLDVKLLNELGKELYKHYHNCEVTKILTVEASGIALSCITAQFFNCNVVFAKKTKTANMDGASYSAECFSYTHQKLNNLVISKEYLTKDDKVLIVDDFMAYGEAANACIDLVRQAGATLVGVGIAIEKGFQGGGDKLRDKGIDVCSLAIIDSMDDTSLVFRKQ